MEKEVLQPRQEQTSHKGLAHYLVQLGSSLKGVLDDMIYDREINEDLQSLVSLLVDLQNHYKTYQIEESLCNGEKNPDEMYQTFINIYDFIDQYDVRDIEALKIEYRNRYKTSEYSNGENITDKQVKCLYEGADFITGEMWNLRERDIHDVKLKDLRQEAGEWMHRLFTPEELAAMQIFLEEVAQQLPKITSYLNTIKAIGSPKTTKFVQQLQQPD